MLGSILSTAAVALAVFSVLAGLVAVAHASVEAEANRPEPVRVRAAASAPSAGSALDAPRVRAERPRRAALPALGPHQQRLMVAVRPGRLTTSIARVRVYKAGSKWRIVVSDLRGGHARWALYGKARLRNGKTLPLGLFSIRPRCNPLDAASAPGVRAGRMQDPARRSVLCVKNGQRGSGGSTSGRYEVIVKFKGTKPRARGLAKKIVLRTYIR